MKSVLDYKGSKFDTLIHISDIHVRLYKRHSEFKEVFKTLYKSIDQWVVDNPSKSACIVLTGDIVHAKTDMSPELVETVSDLLKTLADKLPTVLILGNHDLNLANKSRLDALTPVVNSLNHKNLYYMRESGVYQIANVDFALFSVVGSKEDWPSADDCDAEYKVVMHHGPVYNSSTDVGYTITSRHVEIQDFDGFDFALLGDIHKYQVLQYKNKNKPLVVYAGSLIQQNHGENLDHHGWVEWDLPNATHTHHEVKNSYGYATIRLKKGERFKMPDLPDNVRLRMICEDVPAARVKRILSMIRRKYTIAESSITRSKTLTGDVPTNVSALLNVQDIAYQNKLLKEYIEKNFPHLDEDTVVKVVEINNHINERVDDDAIPKNVQWKPVLLEFDNLFTYGRGNSIKMDVMEGIYGLFGPNATGKSYSMEALCYALYDKTPRAFKGDKIMNSRRDDFFVKLTFEIGEQQYRITRKGTRKKNGAVKVDVDFERETEKGRESLNGEDRRSTNYIIRSYVGDFEDFILTTLSAQGQNSIFVDKGQSERKDLIARFMGLTIFDKLYEMALEESREILGIIKKFNMDDFTGDLSNLQQSIEEKHVEYRELRTDHTNIKEVISNLTDEVNELYQSKSAVQEVDIPKLEKSLEDTKKKKSSISDEVEEEKLKLGKLVEKIQTCEDKIESLGDIRDITQKCETYTSQSMHVSELNVVKTGLESDVRNLSRTTSWLEDHEYDPECEYCVSNVFFKDAQNSVSQLNENKYKLDDLNKSIVEAKIYLDDLSTFVSLNDQIDEINRVKVGLERSKLTTELTLERKISEESGLATAISTLEDRIHVARQYEAQIKKNIEIQKEIRALEDTRSDLQTDEKKISNKIQRVYADLEVLKSKKETLIGRIKEAEDLQQSYEAYQAYLSAVGRDGISYQLISRVLPLVENKTNDILSQIVDFKIKLEVDGRNIEGVLEYDDSRVWSLEGASNAEKFLSGLAIRVALMSISSLPRSNFLIIDEGLGTLDADNKSQFHMLLNFLKEEFDFMVVISHLDIVRDIVENLIEIERDDGYSKIVM
jgi:DNA repair exonuclease SbcCD ATPase subunit